jgi:hypothetical protein
MLWREISSDMFKLWYLAEQDMLRHGAGYRLCDTGQGLNRVQVRHIRLCVALADIIWLYIGKCTVGQVSLSFYAVQWLQLPSTGCIPAATNRVCQSHVVCMCYVLTYVFASSLQGAPGVSRAMSGILSRCQQAIGHWVGSSVVHLGDHNVPNALFFLNKYTQVGG